MPRRHCRSSTRRPLPLLSIVVILATGAWTAASAEDNKTAAPGFEVRSEPLVWPNERPQDCPFEQSGELVGIKFLGCACDYRVGDTWYPTWSADDNLYSPFTDGPVGSDLSISDASCIASTMGGPQV